MAPKRSAKVVAKTTRKVVRETVIVAVVSSDQKPAVVGDENKENEGITDLSEQVNQSVQIPVEGKSQEEKQGEAREEDQQERASKKDQENEGITDLSEQIPVEGKSQEENQTIPTSQQEGASKKDIGEERKRKRRRKEGGGEEYKRYVFRVLKQVHPGMGISSKAMTVLNNLMSDMFERVAEEAARLSKYTGRVTLSSREIQGAVRLVFPGELGKHAVAEGSKAVTTYVTNNARASKS